MAKKNKNFYLKTNNNNTRFSSAKKQNIILSFDTSFFKMMKNNQLPIKLSTFIVLSVLSGAIVYVIYSIILNNQILAIGVGLFSLIIPYITLKPILALKKIVEDALAYKSFIFALESSIRATNSTQEAILMLSEEKSLHPNIKEIIDSISLNLKLGGSVETALTEAINVANDVYVKMAFTILKINHTLGASTTIDALENIQKSMDNRIDDIQLLKSKIDSLISEKSIFLLLTLGSPIFIKLTLNNVMENVFNNSGIAMLMLLVYIFVFVGQIIINKKADKMIEKL